MRWFRPSELAGIALSPMAEYALKKSRVDCWKPIVRMFKDLRVILIGGSSHAGKSTVAQALAVQLGWSHQSTDKLAKHPGRPWRAPPKSIPEHVAAHYLTLSVDELIVDVMRHYRDSVWPLVEALVASHATGVASERLVLEGSAQLPELVATMTFEKVAAVWLTGSRELFEQRIHQTSAYETKSPLELEMIDRFLGRTCLYNEGMVNAVSRLGLASIHVDNAGNGDELLGACLAELGKQDTPAARARMRQPLA